MALEPLGCRNRRPAGDQEPDSRQRERRGDNTQVNAAVGGTATAVGDVVVVVVVVVCMRGTRLGEMKPREVV